jgi:hypothetical protein
LTRGGLNFFRLTQQQFQYQPAPMQMQPDSGPKPPIHGQTLVTRWHVDC